MNETATPSIQQTDSMTKKRQYLKYQWFTSLPYEIITNIFSYLNQIECLISMAVYYFNMSSKE